MPDQSTSTPKYRIGIDARFFRMETGGIGRYTQELVRHLSQIDVHNDYVVFITPADEPEWDTDQPNFRKVVVPARHYSKAEQTIFPRALNRENLDLVHFLNFNHPILYRRPFVTTLHDMTMFFHAGGKDSRSKIKLALFRTLFKRAFSRAKRVIAISEYSARDAEKHLGISRSKIDVVYEGGPEAGDEPENRKAIEEYLGTESPYFLFLSQWRPHKGILTLIDGFNLFKERTGLPHKLVIGGKKNVVLDEVRERLERSKDILTPGFVPDDLLTGLYTASTAFVMPSEYEGFGLPVLEAMAASTATILADNSSLPEVGGDAALMFPTRDAGALADRLEQICREHGLREQLIQRGFEQLHKFSWERCAAQTRATYMRVLEGRS